jgi:hypothetical protein
MDQETRRKIEKFHGLDFCEHGKQRMRCPKCCWEVPTIYRKEQEEYAKKRFYDIRPLTNPAGNGNLV